MQATDVIIYRNKAYVPTTAQMEAGPYWAVAPVHSSNLTVEELAQIIEMATKTGNPIVPTPTREEFQRHRDPILEAIGLKSWKNLAKDGASYGIEFQDDQVTLYTSKVDNKGRFVHDPTKTQQLQKDVDIRDIASIIIADWNARTR